MQEAMGGRSTSEVSWLSFALWQATQASTLWARWEKLACGSQEAGMDGGEISGKARGEISDRARPSPPFGQVISWQRWQSLRKSTVSAIAT